MIDDMCDFLTRVAETGDIAGHEQYHGPAFVKTVNSILELRRMASIKSTMLELSPNERN